jgi:hypothetical protein
LRDGRVFEHRHFAHCESGVVTSLLRQHGLDLSEPMVFGLAGGLTFAYLPFIKINGMPLLSYRMPPKSIINGIQRRLGVQFRTKKYRNRGEALADLERFVAKDQVVGLQTSVYWLPYFPPEMRFQFNAHNLIVCGKEGEEFIISDPVLEHTVKIRPEDLQNARFARGMLAPKGFLYHPVFIPAGIDLPAAARKSIRKTANMMLHAPVPFGLRGIHLMAGRIEKMGRRKDPRHIRLILGHIVRMQEEIGTGGGGFRFMYAAFLQEASDLLHEPALREASGRLTEAGDLWRQFALLCARAIRSRTDPIDLPPIADILRRCAEAERKVYRMMVSG